MRPPDPDTGTRYRQGKTKHKARPAKGKERKGEGESSCGSCCRHGTHLSSRVLGATRRQGLPSQSHQQTEAPMALVEGPLLLGSGAEFRTRSARGRSGGGVHVCFPFRSYSVCSGWGRGETCVLPSQVRACSYIKMGACTGTQTRLQHVGNMHNPGGVRGYQGWLPTTPGQCSCTPHLWEGISHQVVSPVFAGHTRLMATAEKGGGLTRSCRLN